MNHSHPRLEFVEMVKEQKLQEDGESMSVFNPVDNLLESIRRLEQENQSLRVMVQDVTSKLAKQSDQLSRVAMREPEWISASVYGDFPGNCLTPDDNSLPTIEVLHRYRHRDSGRIYLVSEFILTCDDGDWVDGVLYMSVESGERFVQPLERFKRKMERVT